MTEYGQPLPIHADLHNHTTASDGDFTPEELIQQMAAKRIQVVGVTDHDTLAGLNAALNATKKYPIELLPGVEVSICFQRPEFTGSLHLLCYFDKKRLKDSLFIEEFEKILSQARGQTLLERRVEKINHYFGPEGINPLLKQELTCEQITQFSNNVSRRHFALALEQFHGIKNKSVLSGIIGNDSPAYLPSGIDLSVAATLVQNFHLTPVLAHPAAGSFPGPGHYREVLPPVEVVEQLLPDFLRMGLRGLEVHYPGHTKEHRHLLMSWVKKHHLLITGGSDCHDGSLRPPGISGISRQDYLKLEQEILRAYPI